MAYTYFVDDPVAGPTHAEKTTKSGTVMIRSMGYQSGNPPPSFVVVFEPGFDGKYDKSTSSPSIGGSGSAVSFISSPVGSSGKYQQVKVKLKNVVHPYVGYKYTVVMNGKTLDPRIVPK